MNFAESKIGSLKLPITSSFEKIDFSMIGEFYLNESLFSSSNIVGAFVGEECRGIASSTAVGDGYLYLMTIYGNISPEHNVIMMREYQLSRDNMSEAVQIFPEIDAILKNEDASFMAVVPLLATNMDRLIACYYFRDMSSMGEQIDRVGMSEEFQKIVLKASNTGTLISSRVLLNI